MSLTTVSETSNPLPAPPEGLAYRSASYSNQSYTTTGAFAPGAATRKREDLAWVGSLVLDFDLVDYLSHREGWEGSADAVKARMYRELTATPGALAAAKAEHRAAVLDALSALIQSYRGASMPTFVVDSGWGVHAYFWLTEPTSEQAHIDAARAINKHLVESINAGVGYELADKGVHDAGTRLLRVVGSSNTQAREKAGIDAPQPVVVLPELSTDTARWDMVETWRQLAEQPPARPQVAQAAAAAAPQASAQEDDDAAPVVALPAPSGDVQLDELARVWREALGFFLQRDKALQSSYSTALTKQNSEADMAFACALAGRRVPPCLILVFLAYAVRTHPNDHDGTDYYGRTALNAWQYVRGNEDYDPETNYRLPHPDAVRHLSRGLGDMLIAGVVAQYDPRVSQMLWVDQRTSKIQWEQESDHGRARVHAYHTARDLPLPTTTATGWEFGNNDAQRLCAWVESVYGTNMLRGWRDALGFMVTGLPSRNPVREYLERVAAMVDASPVWSEADGLLDTWLAHAWGLEDTPLLRVISRKWLVGGAARGMNPGVFLKSMLVLVGGQSAGKTTMFRLLGGQHYSSPHTADLGSKDAALECGYSWLLEMEEMSFMSKSTMEHVKRYITTQTDRYRPPYGKEMETFHRGCFYGGSANTMDLLNDPTGADRFWCVELPSAAVCNFEFVRTYRDALWGLAARAWLRLRGTADEVLGINLTREELELLRASNKAFERTDAIEDTLLSAVWARAINRYRDDNTLRVTWEEIRDAMVPKGENPSSILRDLNPSDAARIRQVLERHGFVHRRTWENGRAGRRFWCAPQSWLDAAARGELPPGVAVASSPVPGPRLPLPLPPAMPRGDVGGLVN